MKVQKTRDKIETKIMKNKSCEALLKYWVLVSGVLKVICTIF